MPFGFGSGKGKGRQGRGRGFCRSRGLGPGAKMNCICPNCGLTASYQPDIPCYKRKCPKCDSPMTRQF